MLIRRVVSCSITFFAFSYGRPFCASLVRAGIFTFSISLRWQKGAFFFYQLSVISIYVYTSKFKLLLTLLTWKIWANSGLLPLRTCFTNEFWYFSWENFQFCMKTNENHKKPYSNRRYYLPKKLQFSSNLPQLHTSKHNSKTWKFFAIYVKLSFENAYRFLLFDICFTLRLYRRRKLVVLPL